MDLSEWKEVSRRASGAWAKGRRREARQLMQIALDFAERTRNSVVIAVSLNNLAVLASQSGKFEVAAELLARARALDLPVAEPTGLVSCLQNNAAVNLHRQGNVIEARPLYFESVSNTFAPHRFADPWAAALTNFALLQMEQGKLTQAESLLKRARQSLERLPARDRSAESHLKYANGQLAQMAGRLLKAETDFSELSSGEASDPILLALAQVGLAKVHHKQFNKAIDIDARLAMEKLKWATALLSQALGTLLEAKGAASLEYMEAAITYVDHLCLSNQWEDAEVWVHRLRPWMDYVCQGVHPWTFRLLEHQERIFRQLKKFDEAVEIEKQIVELRFRAKAIIQGESPEEGDDDQ